MKQLFTDLKPMLDYLPKLGHYALSMDCPECGERTVINVNLNGPQQESPVRLWSLKIPEGCYDWNFATISPSITNPPHSRKSTCKVHFSITNGKIMP